MIDHKDELHATMTHDDEVQSWIMMVVHNRAALLDGPAGEDGLIISEADAGAGLAGFLAFQGCFLQLTGCRTSLKGLTVTLLVPPVHTSAACAWHDRSRAILTLNDTNMTEKQQLKQSLPSLPVENMTTSNFAPAEASF